MQQQQQQNFQTFLIKSRRTQSMKNMWKKYKMEKKQKLKWNPKSNIKIIFKLNGIRQVKVLTEKQKQKQKTDKKKTTYIIHI